MTKKKKFCLAVTACFFVFYSPKVQAAKRALVYSGPGACDGCYQAAHDIALRVGLDTAYVSEEALDASSSAEDKEKLFKDAVVWIQPGGKSSTAMNAMTSELKGAVTEFVAKGGGYVGFCAGAFSSTSIVGTTEVKGFGFLLGKTTLFSAVEDSAAIIPLTWNGVVRHVYWEGGPFMSELPVGNTETIAYYPNGQVATARSQFGMGRVYVTGAHPEANARWRAIYDLQDPDGDDFDLAVEMVNWAIAPH